MHEKKDGREITEQKGRERNDGNKKMPVEEKTMPLKEGDRLGLGPLDDKLCRCPIFFAYVLISLLIFQCTNNYYLSWTSGGLFSEVLIHDNTFRIS
jgi:hypothetical protein